MVYIDHSSEHSVTRALSALAAGDEAAVEKLAGLVYPTLRRLALGWASREQLPQSEDATALVNEAYLKVLGRPAPRFENRRHFYGSFSRAIAQVLVDQARRRRVERQRRHLIREKPADVPTACLDQRGERSELEAALQRLEAHDSRAFEVARLKCVGGMSDEAISGLLGISTRTVQREWLFARVFLRREIAGEAGGLP